MGGDAMIGQSTINIMNGARHRVSSTMSGIFMLLFVIALSGFIELLPVSTLTGVLFMVVISTFQWKTFAILRYGRLSDSSVVLLVTFIAVFFNLAVAIAIGIIFSALVHAWDSGDHVDADILYKPMQVRKSKGSGSGRDTSQVEASNEGGYDDDDDDDDSKDSDENEIVDVKYVHVKGSIFFGSTRHFINMFNVSTDPDTIVIDLKDALIIDHSAVAAIGGITHRFAKVGKRVLLVNVPHKSHGRLHRTGDHEVLHQQIVTHPQELHDVEHDAEGLDDEAETLDERTDADANEQQDSGAPEPSSDIPDSLSLFSGYQGDDGVEVTHEVPPHSYGGLNELHMFQAPLGGVVAELEKLCNKSGRFEVHGVHSKKKT